MKAKMSFSVRHRLVSQLVADTRELLVVAGIVAKIEQWFTLQRVIFGQRSEVRGAVEVLLDGGLPWISV